MNFDSRKYWEKRYFDGGNSGKGSYGNLSKFKSKIINEFIEANNISTALELGCGDGNQLKDFKIKKYVGLDVSKTIISKNVETFKNDKNKYFYLESDYLNKEKFDVTLSLDVIYHLVEDTIFEDYIKKLFKFSDKYVIIYTFSDRVKKINFSNHIKYRDINTISEKFKNEWSLHKHIVNEYPTSDPNNGDFSMSDFYIFKKK